MMRRAVLAALLALALGACSRVDLGWRAAPWLLEREGAQWLGLQGEEREAFGRDGRAWLAASGAHMAPKLGRLGRRLAKDIEMGHDGQALALLFDELPQAWDELLGPAVPSLGAWLARDPAKRAEALQAAFDARNAKDFKRWADPARARADREKRLRQGLKDWLGALSPLQEQGLAAWAQEAEFPAELWRADRLRRQQALLTALRRGAAEAEIRALLQAWWLQPEKDRDPAYHRALEAYRQRVRAACGRLLQSLQPAQRERLSQRLLALAQDLEGIAAKSGVQAGGA